MKFEISNLGYIKQAEIELGDLTIICGKNNTGKTYVNYAIYGFLKNLGSNLDFEIKNEIEKLFETGVVRLKLKQYKEKFFTAITKFSQSYSENLHSIFNIDKNGFENASFLAKLEDLGLPYTGGGIDIESTKNLTSLYNKQPLLKLSKPIEQNIIVIDLLVKDQENIPSRSIVENFVNEGLVFIFLSQYFDDAFIITAERTGVSLFYKELDLNKNLMLEKIINKRSMVSDINEIFDDSISRYSKPIQDEINFVRDLEIISRKTGELAKNNPEIITFLTDIIGGDYSVTGNSMSFVFTEENRSQEIPFYSASSTVKSLVNLYFYLKHLAKPGHILIIDEPELNLHPGNQRKLAKLFTRLTKCGLKLLMTTHSDYLIKELNNLIVLNNDFDNKSQLMEKYKYTEQDILDPDKIKVYIAENNTLNLANITPLGIEVESFDEEIINMTNFYDEATNNLDIAYDC